MKPKTIAIFVIYLLFCIFIFFASLEAVLCLLDYRYLPLKVGQSPVNRGVPGADNQAKTFSNKYLVYDPKLIWRTRAANEYFNDQGYRGPELAQEKPENQYRIVTIGDSNTLGPAAEVFWPEILGALLEGISRRFVVVNAGVWGYSSYQGLHRFEEVLRYHPDMVLICFGSNDGHQVYFEDKTYKRLLESSIVELRTFQLFATLADAFSTMTRTQEVLVSRVSPRDFERNYLEMIRQAKKHGVDLIFLTRPYLHAAKSQHPNGSWVNFIEIYNDLTRQIARKNGFPLVDFDERFGNSPERFADDSHFNDLGKQEAAEIVFGAVRARLQEKGAWSKGL